MFHLTKIQDLFTLQMFLFLTKKNPAFFKIKLFLKFLFWQLTTWAVYIDISIIVNDGHKIPIPFKNPLYHSWISDSVNSVLFLKSSSSSGFNLLFCFPMLTNSVRQISYFPLNKKNHLILNYCLRGTVLFDWNDLLYFFGSWSFNVSDNSDALALVKHIGNVLFLSQKLSWSQTLPIQLPEKLFKYILNTLM